MALTASQKSALSDLAYKPINRAALYQLGYNRRTFDALERLSLCAYRDFQFTITEAGRQALKEQS